MIKIGVFGGRRGNSMIDWCKKTKRAQVVAVCDRDEEVIDDLKKEYKKGITFCLTFEELLKCDIDAVILTNYAHQHAPFAIKCLNAGKHVLSEVLPCQNMQEAVGLVEAVERSGKIYSYAENYCYMPAPREMRKLYKSGKLGEFEYGEGEYIHNCEPIWANITYGDKNHWRNNILYANFYCTHSIGPMIHITGLRPLSVVGFELPFTDRCARMGRKTGLAGIEMITLENGGIIRSVHGNLDKNSIKYCIYGSKGRAESASYDSQRGGVERIYVNLDEQEGVYNDNPVNYQPKDEISQLAEDIGCNGFHADSDYYVMHNFINALEGKDAEIIDIYEALDMFLPGLFAYFSILDGGKPQIIPNLREKSEREKYRNDTRCCDEEVAGDMLLPAYSKCEIEIPDEVYSLVREKYLKNLKGQQTMNKIKKLFVTLLGLLTVICTVVGVAFITPKSVNANGSWTITGSITEADGIYTASGNDQAYLSYTGDLTNINTVSADFTYSSGSRYVGYQIYSGSTFYVFGVWLNSGTDPVLLVQKNTTDPANRISRTELAPFGVTTGAKFTLKVILTDDLYEVYIGETLVDSNEKSGHSVGAYAWTSVLPMCDHCAGTMSNISLSTTKEEIPEEPSDWTITGSITEADGIYTASGNDQAYLSYTGDLTNINTVSADFTYSSGSRYVGYQIYSGSTFYVFGVWLNSGTDPVLLVQKNTTDPINRISRTELAPFGVTTGAKFTLKVILTDDLYEVYIGETLVDSSEKSGHSVGTYAWTSVLPMCDHCAGTMSNISVSTTEFAPPEVIEGWVANAEVTESDGVYTTGKNTAVVDYQTSDFSQINTVEAQFNYAGSTETGNIEYTGIEVYSGENYYRFSIWPNTASNGPAVLFIQHNVEDPINRLLRKELSASEFGKNVWWTMKVVIEDNYFAVYLNDILIATSYGLGEDVGAFDISSIKVISKGCPAQFKGLNVGYEKPTFDGYIDLEFNDVRGVYAINSENAEATWADGKMVLSMTAPYAGFEVSDIQVSPGTKYSMRLSVRNTFVVRMKNNSSAESIVLSYITKEDGTYDNVKQKEFAIAPNSDWTTYYFNISDTVTCSHWMQTSTMNNCNCYLSGFKFAFEGATEGSVEIDEISFAREDKIYNYAAESMTAIANENAGTVTVSGTLKAEFANQTVTVLQSDIRNYNELLTWDTNEVLGSAKATGTHFEVTFPLVRENGVSHLSSKLLASVHAEGDYTLGVKLSKQFMIENWRDFAENPYEFTLNDYSVSVLDFGAKGDGFTNDTAAIQSAIDHVNAQGGGKVVVPGDASEYGKRYIMTGIKLKSNVELHIEENAVLWQSHRLSDYPYQVYFGHDNMGSLSVPWGLSALLHEPFIHLDKVENVRVTGGGTIRMDDTGTEWLDGNGYAWDSDITVGCGGIAHLVPIVVYGAKNVEISDLNVRRCSCWHAYIRESENIMFGNVDLAEVNCINGDGLDFSTAVNNVVIERCSLYSNDDAIVVAVTINDPRDDVSVWRWKSTKEDRSIYNFTIRHSNMFGGHGLTFIPWASDNSAADKVEIYNIDAQDNVLGGTSTAVGAWADNPFYGKSSAWLNSYGSTDAVEAGDYSPVRDVTLLNNEYLAPCSFYGINVTNIVTDSKLVGATTFENGNFDKDAKFGSGMKVDGFEDEQTWTTGLSYWSRKGDVGVEKVGEKEVSYINSTATFVQDDHAGYIKGSGELYQGIYNTFGAYIATIDVKLLSGSAKIFARDALTGKSIAEKEITASTVFAPVTLSYSLTRSAYVQIGVSHEGGAEEIVYIDDAVVALDENANIYEIEGEEIEKNFDDGEIDFANKSNGEDVSVESGVLVFGSDGEYKLMLNNSGALDNFELKVDIYVGGKNQVNAGVYLFASNVHNGADLIDAYNVQIESEAGASSYTVTMFRFDNKFSGTSANGGSFERTGDWTTLRIVVKNSVIFVFVGNEKEPCITFEVEEGLSGNVGLRSQFANSKFDNFTLKTSQYVQTGGDKSKLNELVASTAVISEFGFTAESYAVFKEALSAVDALGENAKQSDIDACYNALKSAINGLVKNSAPVVPDVPVIPDDGEELKAMAKEELESVLYMAKGYDAKYYTEESYAILAKAIADGEKLTLNLNASKEDYEAQVLAIKTAVDSLVGQERLPLTSCRGALSTSAFGMVLLLGSLVIFKKKREN